MRTKKKYGILQVFVNFFSYLLIISMDVLDQEAMVLEVIEIHLYGGDEMRHQESSSW